MGAIPYLSFGGRTIGVGQAKARPQMNHAFRIQRLTEAQAATSLCQDILRALPDWFGPPEVHDVYLQDVTNRPAFMLLTGDTPVGIMAVTQTSPSNVDIHLLAVAPDYHGSGAGTALLHHAADFAHAAGAVFLTVKTLGPSHESPAYHKTRAFYRKQGFALLEEFADFWGEGVPMLLMCKAING